jgi:hypothetical protein
MQSTGAIGRGVTFAPSDFSGLLEVANMMAASGAAVPKHLRGNPGMCLSVAMTAYQNEFNPFLLAGDTYVVNDVLAYGAKSIAAMVNNSPKLLQRLRPTWSGTWPNRRCLVKGRIKGETEDHEIEIKAETITVRNSPLWKSQPDIQLGYYSQRAWGRLYLPETLLGVLDREEAQEIDYRSDETSIPRPVRPARAPMRDTLGVQIIDHEPEAQTLSDADAEPAVSDPFILITEDGEEREYDDGITWANVLCAAFNAASSLDHVEGLWESNSRQLEQLRAEHVNGEALADAIIKSYDAVFDKYYEDPFEKIDPREATQTEVAPTRVSTQQAKPAPSANAPRQLGKVPTDARGNFDWRAAAEKLGAAIESSVTLDDVRGWQETNMRWIENIGVNAPDALARLQKRIQATTDILGGAQV